MDTQSRMQEIRKLRSVIAAGSYDFRNVYGRLARILAEVGSRREAANIALEAADHLWAGSKYEGRDPDLVQALIFLRYARLCAPNDRLIHHQCLRRITVIKAAIAAERERLHAQRPRRPHLMLVHSSST